MAKKRSKASAPAEPVVETTVQEVLPSFEDMISEHVCEDTELRHEIITVDEELMEFLLKFNYHEPGSKGNRPHGESLSKLYGDEMLRAEWRDNGEGFIYGYREGEGGELETVCLDGQHRLYGLKSAIARYKASPESFSKISSVEDLFFTCPIVWGVDVAHADTINTGKKRSNSDVLYRWDFTYTQMPEEIQNIEAKRKQWCTMLAEAARLTWIRSWGISVSHAIKFSPSEMLSFISERHPDLCKFVTLVMAAVEKQGEQFKPLSRVSKSYVAALCYISCLTSNGKLVNKDVEKVADFLSGAVDGSGEEGSHSRVMYEYWYKAYEPNKKHGTKDRDMDVVGPMVLVLNALHKGEDITVEDIHAKQKFWREDKDNFKKAYPFIKGYDETCYLAKCAAETAELDAKKAEKDRKIAEAEAKKAAAAAERVRKAKANSKGIFSTDLKVAVRRAPIAVKAKPRSAPAKAVKRRPRAKV